MLKGAQPEAVASESPRMWVVIQKEWVVVEEPVWMLVESRLVALVCADGIAFDVADQSLVGMAVT